MLRIKKFRNSARGMTLVEMVLYVAFAGVVAVGIGNFMIQISRTYQTARAERDTLSHARLLLEQLTKHISQAKDIYMPTSRFNINLGQLSLVTPIGALPLHPSAYLDFWVDNGRLWTRKEGGADFPLSSSSVRVKNFYLERILQATSTQAVRITILIESNTSVAASTTLNSTVALRGVY